MSGESRHAPSRQGRTGTRSGMRDAARRDGAPGRDRPVSRPPAPPVDAEKVAALLEPAIMAAGMDLESVRVAAAGRRRLLRIVVDSDAGAGLDRIAEISRELSSRLDASGVMGEAPYTLEVSSPGVDRPLTEPRHWRRARGRLVTVPLAGAGASATGRPATIKGRVVAAGDGGVTLDTDSGRRDFAYRELGAGRVEVEFGKLDSGDAGEPAAASAGSGEGGDPDGY